MAKVGKLTKLKSAMKRLPSFTKNHHSNTSTSADADDVAAATPSELPKIVKSHDGQANDDLHVVYVGKSRRQYMLSSNIVGHPLFQELVDRSSRSSRHDREIVVACEVVLFEHMLWMLKNNYTGHGDDGRDGFGGGSMEELAEFYTY